MSYLGNYGFIPSTLSDDALDIFVISQTTVQSACIIRCRSVGMIQDGMDEKVIAVPVDDLYPYHSYCLGNLISG